MLSAGVFCAKGGRGGLKGKGNGGPNVGGVRFGGFKKERPGESPGG